MQNWFDHIQFHMRAQPETPAMVMEDRIVTYGMLNAVVDRCARRLLESEPVRARLQEIVRRYAVRVPRGCLAIDGAERDRGACDRFRVTLRHTGHQSADVSAVVNELHGKAYDQVNDDGREHA